MQTLHLKFYSAVWLRFQDIGSVKVSWISRCDQTERKIRPRKKWLDNIRTDGKVLVVSLSVGERLANNKHIYDKLKTNLGKS